MFALLSCSVTAVYPQFAQTDGWESVLETLLSDEELTADALEELSDMYSSLHENPLNINTATRDELSMLPFLTDAQIEDIHAYIYMHGPMLTLGELQLTGSLDYDTRRLLRQFVYPGPLEPRKDSIRLSDVIINGRSELVTRLDIPLYRRDGFRYHSPRELERYPNRAYLGGRLSNNLRYAFNWHNRIRFGITADKDAGEKGYDFFSPYLFLKDIGFVRELALGNFKVQTGCGLLLGSEFSVGKNMALSSVSGQTQGLKPHSSTQEYGYLCGAGTTIGKGHTKYTLLAAWTPLDATVKGDTVIGSFKQDGYHRTGLEMSKRHNVRLGTIAANVRYSYRGFRIGTTVLAEKLSLPYKSHDRFTGISADFGLNRARYSALAEISVLNGAPAVVASQTLRLPDGWSMNTVFRYYSPRYMAFHSNAIAESSVQNEMGLLAGLARKTRKLKINGYADLFMHPEPRYGASGRSNGTDLRMEADWRVGRRDELFATARFKSKQKDCRYTGRLEYCITGRCRLRWTHQTLSGAELKTQIFYSRYDFIAEPISDGLAVTQSYSRCLLNGRLDLNLTASVFSTDSFDSSISVYESGLRYSFNFITLYGKGARAALTVRYRIGKNLQLNLNAGGTYYSDRDEIGSAQQRIDSCHKEDISVQFIAKF